MYKPNMEALPVADEAPENPVEQENLGEMQYMNISMAVLLDSARLQARHDHFIVRCPRNWTVPINPLPGETLEENCKRLFQPYLPGFTVQQVIGLNGGKISYCSWMVRFVHYFDVEHGLYERIKIFLNCNKPRNTNVSHLWAVGQQGHSFMARYKVCCQCSHQGFYEYENHIVGFSEISKTLKSEDVQ